MADTESSGKIELARAYVQIVPSFNGLSEELKKAFGDAEKEVGGDKGEKLGDEFGKKWSKATTKAVKAGASAIGSLIGASLLEGGKLEQSLGGVETLFKDSADTVVENAQKAFETAGLSANDYMEQATSFAAGLIDSLDGDTEAAAASANTAMIDMADNANKYGSSVESIQNAYQGFMRKSYVMLDNLKLGYGGTKEEMERLLEDAEAISGIEYDIDSLSDVFAAIHVIQEDLGITGTTAEEAATTFQGSFSSMKAAAQNLLAYMSTGEGDVIEAFDDLTETAGTFADNALRMIGNAFDSIYEIISEKTGLSVNAIEGMTEAFAAFVVVVEAAKIANKISDAITAAGGLKSMLSSIATAAGGVTTAVGGIAIALAAVAKTWIDNATDAIDEVGTYTNSLSEDQLELIEDVQNLSQEYANLKTEISDSQADYEAQAASADTMIDRLYELQSQTELTSDEQNEMETLVASLNSEYDGLNLELDETTGLLNMSEAAVRDYVNEQLEQAKANALIEEMTELYKEQYKAKQQYEELEEEYLAAKEKKAQIEEELAQARKKWSDEIIYQDEAVQASWLEYIHELEASEETATNTLGDVGASYSAAGETMRGVESDIQDLTDYMNSDEYSIAAENVVSANESLVDSMQKVSYDGVEYVKGSFSELMAQITDIRDEYLETYASTVEDVWNSFDLFDEDVGVTYVTETWTDENGIEQTETYLETTKNNLQEALDNNLENIEGWTSEVQSLYERGISDTLYQTLVDMGVDSRDQVHALTTMTDEELQEYSAKFDEAYGAAEDVADAQLKLIRDENAETIAGLISDTTGQKENMEQAYALLASYSASGYIDEIRRQIPSMYQATQDALDGATSGLDGYVWDKGHYIAEQLAEGMKQGIFDGEKSLQDDAVSSIAVDTINTVNELFEVGSPSKVMKEIGGYVTAGLAIGIADGAGDVLEASNEVGMSAIEGIQTEFDGAQNSITAQTAINTATHLDGTVTVNGELSLLQQAVALLTAIRNKSTTLNLDGKTVGTTISPYVDSAMGQAYVYSQRGVAT